MAVNMHLAAIRLFKPAEHSQKCRFATTGWTKQCQKLAVINPQRYIINRRRRAEVFAQMINVYQRCHRSFLLCVRAANITKTAVSTINTVDAALTSGVTEKRTIELILTGKVILPGPAVK